MSKIYLIWRGYYDWDSSPTPEKAFGTLKKAKNYLNSIINDPNSIPNHIDKAEWKASHDEEIGFELWGQNRSCLVFPETTIQYRMYDAWWVGEMEVE